MSNRKSSIAILAGALALAAAPAFAHPGGGPPAGVGGGMGSAGGFGGPPSWAGTGGGPNGTFGNQGGLSAGASTRVLSNTHVSTALTGALSHSGVTLPSGGLQAACSGFGSLGGCVAALHVSQNLSLPGGFDALKALMTGTSKMKLGAAITQLQPSADAKAEARKANRQAHQDLEGSETD